MASLPPISSQAGMPSTTASSLHGYAETKIRPFLNPLLVQMLAERPDSPRSFLSEQLYMKLPSPVRSIKGSAAEIQQTTRPFAGARRGDRLPTRIIFIRHGQSEGNVNEKLYASTPDNQMPLSELGKQQAAEAGQTLRAQLGDTPFTCWASPYLRTQQTAEGLLSAWPAEQRPIISQEPELREQEFGNFQDLESNKNFVPVCPSMLHYLLLPLRSPPVLFLF